MTHELFGRLVRAFESIASSLEGINETGKRQFAKEYPEPRAFREAVYSKVPSKEELIRQDQGSSDKPILEWLTDLAEDAYIGNREREFIESQQRNSNSQDIGTSKTHRRSSKKIGS